MVWVIMRRRRVSSESRRSSYSSCILTYAIIYVLIHHIIFWLYLYFLNILYFFKYSCTNIFHRRSLCTFYCQLHLTEHFKFRWIYKMTGDLLHCASNNTSVVWYEFSTLHWCPKSLPNHRKLGCCLNSLLRLTTKKASKHSITGPLWGEPTSDWCHQNVTGICILQL